MAENDLKSWIKKELVSNTDLAEKILLEHKERVKDLVAIKNDGTVVVNKSDLSAKLKIGLYLLGAAYAKIAELRLKLREALGRTAGFPQLLLRIGYGKDVKATPRRDVGEVISQS